jgi:hypothetical protein
MRTIVAIMNHRTKLILETTIVVNNYRTKSNENNCIGPPVGGGSDCRYVCKADISYKRNKSNELVNRNVAETMIDIHNNELSVVIY